MRFRYKILIAILLLITAVFFLVKLQARRIVTNLIESNTQGAIQVEIGVINLHPLQNSIGIKSLKVLVKDRTTSGYKSVKIDKVFLDVVSLWDFVSGGTLIIEKLECEGAELFIYNNSKSDSSSHAFNLNEVIQRIKKDAVRFSIQDISFKDVNLILSKDTLDSPTTIMHLNARIQNLNLSQDTLLNKKPLVEFNLPGQVVRLPGKLSLGFDSLAFTTVDNSIQFLNLELKSPPASNNKYYVQSDKVRISNFSFESLYKTGRISIDSIFLGKSKVIVDWAVIHSKKDNKIKQQRLLAIPYVVIDNILFKEFASEVVIRNDSIMNNFKINKASLLVDKFIHNPDSNRIISSPYYNLVISKYSTFLGDSNKSINFDTIQIQKHSLSLLNFTYKEKQQKQPLLFTPRLNLKNVDWYEFLINRKLLADELLISDPTIKTTIRTGDERQNRPINSFKVVEILNEYFKVNIFSVANGKAFVEVPFREMNVVLDGYSTSIKVSDLINSDNVNHGLDAIRYLSFNILRMSNPDFNIQVEKFHFANRMVLVGALNFKDTKELEFKTEGLKFDYVNWSESANALSMEKLGWDNIRAEIRGGLKNAKSPDAKQDNLPMVYVKYVNGGKADILYRNEDMSLTGSLEQLNLKSLMLRDSVRFSELDLMGSSLILGTKLNDVRIGKFYLTDSGGEINDIWFNRNTAEYMNVILGKLSFKTNLSDLISKRYYLNELELDKLRARFSKQDSIQNIDLDLEGKLVASNLNYNDLQFSIGSIYFNAGPFNLRREKMVAKSAVNTENNFQTKKLRLKIEIDSAIHKSNSFNNLSYSPSGSKLKNSVADTSLFSRKRFQLGSDRGEMKFYLTNVTASLGDSTKMAGATVNKIEFSDIDFSTDKLVAWLKKGSMDNLVISPVEKLNLLHLIEDNYKTTGLHLAQGRISVNENTINYGSLTYNPQSVTTSIKNFEFKPDKEMQKFLDDNFYQANYLSTKVESISLERFNMKRFLDDTVLHIGVVKVGSPNLYLGRDKTHPFLAKTIKPLPTNAFKRLPIDFKVDTMRVYDGAISYTERSKITGQNGTIDFTGMNAMVRNIKNVDLDRYDSLYISASTKFMDSAIVKLRVRESYRDTLGGFLMTTNVSPFHTSILNKALVPMVSVDFKSGFVDTLHMRAIGREYLALGSMKFLYHDLKVEFLDKNDTARHSIKNQLLKFAANTFVIRDKNRDRVGDVYFERDRYRAVFQYWVKMILSGVTTSVGAKSNRKQIRKYKKSLNQKRLPRIEGKFDL